MKNQTLLKTAILTIGLLGAVHTAGAYQADNSGVNTRDQNQALPTPPTQKENDLDLSITQKIRQAISADDALSLNAKNSKIITQNGVVTLRGPVDTMAERDTIGKKAQQVAGVTRVSNLLEVVGSK